MTKKSDIPMPPYPKGIYRIDDERRQIHGWGASVQRTSGKAQRIFRDKMHGGRETAYQLAIAWAEEHLKKFPAKPRIALMTTLRRNNRSGVPGVYRYPADGSDKLGACWIARWAVTPNARQKFRKFSIDLYGEEQAKQLAIQARTRAMQALAGIVPAEPEIEPKPRPRIKATLERPPADFIQNLPKGIRRIDDERNHTHGWNAIVSRTSGVAHRVFSDGAYGGWEAAYQLAVDWVAEQFKKYPAQSRIDYINTLRRNNRSGVPGVTRYPADGSDRPDAYWLARWVVSPNDRPKSRKFSIARYGESQAKWLAIQARVKAVEMMEGIEFAERSTRVYRRKKRSS